MKEKQTIKMLRLDKYLADMGIASRSQLKKMASSKQILVNGCLALNTNLKITPGRDEVIVSGQKIEYRQYEYYLLNKPAGMISATKDSRQQTVLELLTTKQRKDLFPVGRLDKDTEGLLLITNDGELAHRLLSPKKHVAKRYFARVIGRVTTADIQQFQAGVDIGDDRPTLPAELTVLLEDKLSEVIITICEGRFHQIKRMFQAVGKTVSYLKRISMGTLVLDDSLAPGEYRALTGEEIRGLKEDDTKR